MKKSVPYVELHLDPCFTSHVHESMRIVEQHFSTSNMNIERWQPAKIGV